MKKTAYLLAILFIGSGSVVWAKGQRSTQVAICGDGIIQQSEECDPKSPIWGSFCTPECKRVPFCGDGELDPHERCDDGNVAEGDGCDSACQKESLVKKEKQSAEPVQDEAEEIQEAVCGNGVVDPSEQCDPGDQESNICTPDCRIVIVETATTSNPAESEETEPTDFDPAPEIGPEGA